MQKSLNTGYEVRTIGLDFCAAFDCVTSKSPIFKFRQMGIGETSLNIIIESLAGRKQRVVVDGQCSDYRDAISGVSQANVLGPLLFILYTSDVWSYMKNRPVACPDVATFFASRLFPTYETFHC